MRVDVVTIFPDYLSPLDLSLIGKARRDGLLDLRTWNLRDFASDRHSTVDDTPYGGGAGMVMIPTTWGDALDAVLADIRESQGGARPRLIVPGPGGRRFSQALAHDFAGESHLVFACGRYEGIDERVYDHAREAFDGRVDIVSLGDYVLAGGEVAVLAMTEAIVRLLPGVVGNAESLIEESHEDGLLEYPVYTRPPLWRGRQVPAVLLGGDHGAIAAWRHRQRLERTVARRPDLLPPSAVPEAVGAGDIVVAAPGDAGELFTLTRACLPDCSDSLDDLMASLGEWTTLVARVAGRLVGTVRTRRATPSAGECPDVSGRTLLDRLLVAPDVRRRGLGGALLAAATNSASDPVIEPTGCRGAEGEAFVRMLTKAGYRPARASDPRLWRKRRR